MSAILIEHLSKHFQVEGKGDPLFALKDVSITVERGSVFGIVGMSGAGKSTLMRCMVGLSEPSSGRVVIENQPITGSFGNELRQKRQKIGMIFQHFNLFSARSALKNVCYPMEVAKVPKKEQVKRATKLLKIVELEGKERKMPAELSGGEKQRVAIARALANRPHILLCDEATSALDPRTKEGILELLASLNQKLKLTIVLITHEMEVVKKICHRLAVLENGSVVEEGSVLDLFSHPKHPTTRHFLQHLPRELPQELVVAKPKRNLLRLRFKGKTAKEPIITELIRAIDIEVNILLGAIDSVHGGHVGSLLVALKGSASDLGKARLFLKQKHVVVEEIDG